MSAPSAGGSAGDAGGGGGGEIWTLESAFRDYHRRRAWRVVIWHCPPNAADPVAFLAWRTRTTRAMIDAGRQRARFSELSAYLPGCAIVVYP